MDFKEHKEKLQKAGVVFAEGLSPFEIQVVEVSFGFTFPPDLKQFLMFALPATKRHTKPQMCENQQ